MSKYAKEKAQQDYKDNIDEWIQKCPECGETLMETIAGDEDISFDGVYCKNGCDLRSHYGY